MADDSQANTSVSAGRAIEKVKQRGCPMPKRVNELKKKRGSNSPQAVKGLSAAGRGARKPAKRYLPRPGPLTVVQILRDMLASHSVDVVEAVNNILEWMPASGIRCARLPDTWVVESRGVRQELTALPRSLSMLRSICARLAILNHESTGVDAFLYGGEGDVVVSDKRMGIRRYHVATMNTPSEQWFNILPIKDEA